MSSDRAAVLVHMTDPNDLLVEQLRAEQPPTRPLSVEATLQVLDSHFRRHIGGRLPALGVIAALECMADVTGWYLAVTPRLNGAQVLLQSDWDMVSVYEVLPAAVTTHDLERVNHQLKAISADPVDHYVFVTTDRIDPVVADHAATLYEATGGTEFAILDCHGFLRHFLHLFHRQRTAFLDAYQSLLLDEPDSAVGLPLKEAFLALRAAATTAE